MWVAEYSRDRLLFNVREIKADSKVDAECQAWDGYLHLADCLTVTVYKIVMQEILILPLSERKNLAGEKRRGHGFKRIAA